MPNIEIHGLVHVKGHDNNVTSFDFTNALEMKRAINQVMRNIGLGEDAITIVVLSLAWPCNNNFKAMPYLRVCSPEPEQIKIIVKALTEANLKIDIETLLLDSFISAT